MLLNLWTDSEDPFARLAFDESATPLWQRWVGRARQAALDGQFDLARAHLQQLLESLSHIPGETGAARLAVELELARLPSPRGYLQSAAMLQRFLDDLERAPSCSGLKAILRAVGQSERELVQILLKVSSDESRLFGDIPREMAFNRVRAVSDLGRDHPAVGLLNYHLAMGSLRLRDHETALEFLSEANACFQNPRLRAEQFAHERSDVLLTWAELAVDLGNLDQAEALLQRVLQLKDARRGKKPPSGIPLGSDGLHVTDRLGLAKCYGLLGKLQHCQGRYDQALASFDADSSLSSKPRDQGFVANRRAQIYLEMGAHDVAEQMFRENAQRRDGALLNRAFAYLGLARTILAKTTPTAPTDAIKGPRLVQRRRQTRQEVQAALEQVRHTTERLTGPNRALLHDLLDSHEQAWRALESLDTADLATYEEVRQKLAAKAQQLLGRHELLRAADLLESLLRMEWWAWYAHGYVSPRGEAEIFEQLLDLWERLGARERLDRLEQWANLSGYDAIHRVLLERYLQVVERGKEVQPRRTMTTLFTDIRDYSGHCRALKEPERIAELEADLFRAINPVIQAHRGTILRYQGDSILVVFNLYGHDPHHADHAVSCALEIQRAVRHWNNLRQSYEPQARPLELPTGIHTGKAAVAHFRIPGRREMTIIGNAVNLAKRIQQTTKRFPVELVLISGATRARVQRCVFRAIRLLAQEAFKGYESDRDAFLDVYAVRPAVPNRTSFIEVGSVLNSQRGIVALDVGNRAEVGILDHHQPGVVGCATSLVYDHPDWVAPAGGDRQPTAAGADQEIVVHAQPDLDCCAATLLALEVIEGRFPRDGTAENNRHQAALKALADYATRIDRGNVRVDDADPASSPYALIAVSEQVLIQQPGHFPPSQLHLDRRRLECGVHVLHLAIQHFLEDPSARELDFIFRDRLPRQLQELAELARRDAGIYREEDRPRIQLLTNLAVPLRADTKQRRVQRAALLTEPRSGLFKVWMRSDGYDLLVVDTPRDPFHTLSNQIIPLRRYVVSVLPDSGLTLADLGAELDRRETERRSALVQETGAQPLARGGPPRPGFGNSDPWYDGRSAVLAHTIVDAPRQGSVLTLAEVLGVLQALYGCDPHPDPIT